ncbi:MAG: UDP-N-acetylglucosamine diphosphorylase/glucosamine-1-phosphate N-acetyltransferase, partial [Synergistales bacterium]|nr:UDP-N-acetylglucosamine diphosphorylase/glucosamine-1-phosphate N-acetyltransferase [Synergistales bacterium]
SGVKFIDPLSVWVGPEVTFEGEAIVYPGVQIWGNTSIGVKSTIGSFSTLRNAVLEESVTLNGYCFIEDSILKRGSKAGPFCYIRERSVLDQDGFIGKFVEVKKSHVGRGSKVPHLSYMGDASLGEGVNIGAGTITCNYDGKSKHPTKIGDGVFVGSDTMLVAPLTLGARSMTGAGSVITKDVPDEALAIGRAKQRNILGWNGDRSKKSEGIDHDDK